MITVFYERINTKTVNAGVNKFSEKFKAPEGWHEPSPYRRSTNISSKQHKIL